MYPVPTEAATQGRTDAYIASWLAKDKARRGKVVLATKVAGASERITWLRDGNKARAARAARRDEPLRADTVPCALVRALRRERG